MTSRSKPSPKGTAYIVSPPRLALQRQSEGSRSFSANESLFSCDKNHGPSVHGHQPCLPTALVYAGNVNRVYFSRRVGHRHGQEKRGPRKNKRDAKRKRSELVSAAAVMMIVMAMAAAAAETKGVVIVKTKRRKRRERKRKETVWRRTRRGLLRTLPRGG